MGKSILKGILNKRGCRIRFLLFFLLLYAVFLLVWIWIKDYYGLVITYIASHLVSYVKDVHISWIHMEESIIRVGFIPERYSLERILIEITVRNYSYTFNVPLTLAIMFAFYPLLKRRLVYIWIVLILFFLHIFFVFSLEGQRLTSVMTGRGFEKDDKIDVFLWSSIHGFIGSMAIRFEPFLVGIYMYFRRLKNM